MKRSITLLGSLLALQLITAAGLLWGKRADEQQFAQQSLLPFDIQQVDRIIIADSGHKVALSKRQGQWLLPELQDLPADAARLDELLDRLGDITTDWPVATTASAAERFAVAETAFQRHLQFFTDQKLLGELYLGTSPGFRKVHLRRVDENEIYAVTLSTHEFPPSAEAWLDKSLLAADDIAIIEGVDFRLKKADGEWQVEATLPGPESHGDTSTNGSTKDTRPVDGDAAERLTLALSTLHITGLVETPPEALIDDSTKPATLRITGANGEWTYYLSEDNGRYFIRRNDIDAVFSISKITYDNLGGVKLSDLLTDTEASTADNVESEGDKPEDMAGNAKSGSAAGTPPPDNT